MTGQSTAAPLAGAERTNAALAVFVTAACGLAWGRAGLIAAGLGALLSVANLWATLRLAGRAVAGAEEGTRGLAADLTAGLVLKMGALFIILWLALRVGKLDVLPLGLGLSVFAVSLLLFGLWTGVRERAEET